MAYKDFFSSGAKQKVYGSVVPPKTCHTLLHFIFLTFFLDFLVEVVDIQRLVGRVLHRVSSSAPR